ncbi:MAG: CBS domain-containing protein [Candidatus Diapherotrites archaeon]|nr:CBS domain-containing protein [Candidatus Diapherotrites archaeon]
MLPALSEIRVRRKQLLLTQSELAVQTNVSQSLVAKIESNATVPGYDNAKKIFDYLDSLEQKNQLSARDLFSALVFTIDSEASIKKAVKLMEQHSVSQLPVLKNGAVIGTIHEKDLLHHITKNPNPETMGSTPVDAVMTDALPQVSPDTPFKAVSTLLEHHDAVLVTKNGKISGILTKADLLKVILNQKRKVVHF